MDMPYTFVIPLPDKLNYAHVVNNNNNTVERISRLQITKRIPIQQGRTNKKYKETKKE
jgi:hypothetical protein